MFRLKHFRKAHELRQSELAEVLGITQSNISRMENEEIDLTPTQLNRLRTKFDDVDDFIVDGLFFPSKGNVLSGKGNQNNGYQVSADKELIDVIAKQNETIAHQLEQQNRLIEQQAQLTGSIMRVLEKIANKD